MCADVASLDDVFAPEYFLIVCRSKSVTRRCQQVCRKKGGVTKKDNRRKHRRETRQLLAMSLACLRLGCVPVQSKGIVTAFVKTALFLFTLLCCFG